MKNFSSKWIRFSGNSIKSCVGFIDLVDSTKNIATMNNLENIRKYYSTFINSVSEIVKSYNGKIIKNIGDCLLFYFPKTSDNKNVEAFRETIECGFKIIDGRHSINEELFRQHLPPFAYRISIDYGIMDFALVGDYSQIDLFGSTVNLCSKINSSLSILNEIVIGDNIYRILKSFSSIVDEFNFSYNGEYEITQITKYSTYNIKRKKIWIFNNREISNISSITEKQPSSFIEYKNENSFLFMKTNNNKIIIIVDDEQDILFTYRNFLNNYDYQITSFADPYLALNYIRDNQNLDLLVILDIRMKNLNGLQLYQEIKTMDPTIKILFVTALDIIEEILTIAPGLSKEQIMRKPALLHNSFKQSIFILFFTYLIVML
jgi:CheY-like chemotaxis protein/class 3 adenylate cyclase